jgi:hypothetical protein
MYAVTKAGKLQIRVTTQEAGSGSNLAGLTGDNQLYTTGRIRESVEGFYVTD